MVYGLDYGALKSCAALDVDSKESSFFFFFRKENNTANTKTIGRYIN